MDPKAKGSAEPAAVLVADDDNEARETVAEILRHEGFHVVTARDGQDAVDWMSHSPRPAAILLDLSMPRMGGREVLKWLRRRRRFAAVPVCVMSAETDGIEGVALAVQKPLFMRRLTRVLEFLREAIQRPAVA
jgi:CheY-like chemotaxis protein